MAESVSAQLSDSCIGTCSLKFSPKSRIGIRQSPQLKRAGENPIHSQCNLCCLSPRIQTPQEFLGNNQRFSGTSGLHVANVLPDDAAFDAKTCVEPVYVRPSQGETFADAKTKTDANHCHGSEGLP